jgi:signal transduction histidine kinase
VKGANCDGIWNEAGTFIKLKIKPRFYQTKYWHPTVVGTLILLIILFFTARTKLKIRRSLELERIRNQEKERVQKTIAADFHDELGQKLTKISLFSEIVKTKLLNKSPDDIEYINKISKAAKELSSSTRDFIWTLNPTQDSLHDVVIYLKDFGDELFDKTGIDFRVAGISSQLEGINLPMEWRRHLILIFKEAMNNVIKHSECSGLTFHVSVNENKFELSLSDNGIGCLNGKLSGGQGLTNMKHRAELIHGNLDIIFDEGIGTTIRFSGEIPRMGY